MNIFVVYRYYRDYRKVLCYNPLILNRLKNSVSVMIQRLFYWFDSFYSFLTFACLTDKQDRDSSKWYFKKPRFWGGVKDFLFLACLNPQAYSRLIPIMTQYTVRCFKLPSAIPYFTGQKGVVGLKTRKCFWS